MTLLLSGKAMRWPSLQKLLIIMKLTAVILLVSALHVSAGTFSQKVNVKARNLPLENIFRIITKQTGFQFVYTKDIIEKSRPVTIILENVELKDALKKCLNEQQRLDFEITPDKIIVVTPTMALSPLLNEKAPPVTGVIRGPDGKPIAGANVIVKGTTRGAVTNADGDFIITADVGQVLIISSVEFESKEIKITTTELGTVILAIKATSMETVSITSKGYYTTKQELNTGTVGTVKAKDIDKQPVSNTLMALEGRVAGLYISQNTGVVGGGLKVNLRGLNSIANGTAPLYIVDGVPFNTSALSQVGNATSGNISPFTSLRPQDIESVDVLKDADATAIYGSRGANGVILITTKKGVSGKPRVDINIYQSMSRVPKLMKFMNTQEYLAMRAEGFENDNAIPKSYESDVNGDWQDMDRYTDWQKLLIGGTAEATDARASISGGTPLTQYFIGVGYRRETMVFPGDYVNKAGSLNFNITQLSENKKFRVTFGGNYSNTNYKLPTSDLTQYVTMAPNAPAIYDEEGNINWENNTFYNPFAYLLQKSQIATDNLVTNMGLSYQLSKSLEFKVRAGYNFTKVNDHQVVPYSSIIPKDPSSAIYNRSYQEGNSAAKTWIAEPQLNYHKEIGDHSIEGFIAASWQQTSTNGSFMTASGFSSDALIESPQTAKFQNVSTNSSQYRYSAVFARLGYNYQEKYVLNLTARRDGSSRFGPENRFGNFGAIGMAWIFSKENFIKNKWTFLSFGKIKTSIGRTGNDQLGDYQYLSTYVGTSIAYSDLTGLLPIRLTNPYYGWETINKFELGAEFGFLNDRIFLSSNYYRNRTKDQLVGYSLPYITGFNTILANLPATIQNNGLEFELNTKNITKKNFGWSSSFNISFPKNKLLSYPNLEGSSYAQTYVIGQPLTIRFLYKYKGVDPTTGIYSFEDLNGDGNIRYTDDRIPVFIGQKFFGGFGNVFNYKGIAVDVFIQFVKQTGYKYVNNGAPGRFKVNGANQPISVLDRWQKVGDVTSHQKFSATPGDAYSANDTREFSTDIVTDASFARLKNLSLSWNLPARLIEPIKFKSLRVYAQGQNLLTFTNYEGVDPEIPSSSVYLLAPLKTWSIGIQIGL